NRKLPASIGEDKGPLRAGLKGCMRSRCGVVAMDRAGYPNLHAILKLRHSNSGCGGEREISEVKNISSTSRCQSGRIVVCELARKMLACRGPGVSIEGLGIFGRRGPRLRILGLAANVGIVPI